MQGPTGATREAQRRLSVSTPGCLDQACNLTNLVTFLTYVPPSKQSQHKKRTQRHLTTLPRATARPRFVGPKNINPKFGVRTSETGMRTHLLRHFGTSGCFPIFDSSRPFVHARKQERKNKMTNPYDETKRDRTKTYS
jgi:hypothetical protein